MALTGTSYYDANNYLYNTDSQGNIISSNDPTALNIINQTNNDAQTAATQQAAIDPNYQYNSVMYNPRDYYDDSKTPSGFLTQTGAQDYLRQQSISHALNETLATLGLPGISEPIDTTVKEGYSPVQMAEYLQKLNDEKADFIRKAAAESGQSLPEGSGFEGLQGVRLADVVSTYKSYIDQKAQNGEISQPEAVKQTYESATGNDGSFITNTPTDGSYSNPYNSGTVPFRNIGAEEFGDYIRGQSQYLLSNLDTPSYGPETVVDLNENQKQAMDAALKYAESMGGSIEQIQQNYLNALNAGDGSTPESQAAIQAALDYAGTQSNIPTSFNSQNVSASQVSQPGQVGNIDGPTINASIGQYGDISPAQAAAINASVGSYGDVQNVQAGQIGASIGNWGGGAPQVSGPGSVPSFGQNVPGVSAQSIGSYGGNVPGVDLGSVGQYGGGAPQVGASQIGMPGQAPTINAPTISKYAQDVPTIDGPGEVGQVVQVNPGVDPTQALNRQMAGQVSPVLSALTEQQLGLAGRAFGDALSSSLRGYQRDVLPALQQAESLPAEAAQHFLEQVAPELRSGSISSGQYGGSRQNLNKQLAAERIGDEVARQTGNIGVAATLGAGDLAQQLSQQVGRFGEAAAQTAGAVSANAYESAQDRAVEAAKAASGYSLGQQGVGLEAQIANQQAQLATNQLSQTGQIATGNLYLEAQRLQQAGDIEGAQMVMQAAMQNAANYLQSQGMQVDAQAINAQMQQAAQIANQSTYMQGQQMQQTGDIQRSQLMQNAQQIMQDGYLRAQQLQLSGDIAGAEMALQAAQANAQNYLQGQQMAQTGWIAGQELNQNAQLANQSAYMQGQELGLRGDIAAGDLAAQQANMFLQAQLANQQAGLQGQELALRGDIANADIATQNALLQQQMAIANQNAQLQGQELGLRGDIANADIASQQAQMWLQAQLANQNTQLANQQLGLEASQFNSSQDLQAQLANQNQMLELARLEQSGAISAEQANLARAQLSANIGLTQQQLGLDALSQQNQLFQQAPSMMSLGLMPSTIQETVGNAYYNQDAMKAAEQNAIWQYNQAAPWTNLTYASGIGGTMPVMQQQQSQPSANRWGQAWGGALSGASLGSTSGFGVIPGAILGGIAGYYS